MQLVYLSNLIFRWEKIEVHIKKTFVLSFASFSVSFCYKRFIFWMSFGGGAAILVLRIPGVHNALIALSGRDEWMAVITGVDKHIKPRVKPAYEQTGQIPNRFHRGPVSIETDRIYLNFSALICTARIHRYNLLYDHSVVEPIVPVKLMLS